jgi:hypothetical protein
MVILPRVWRSIAKAMRDIDDEARKNDWLRAIIDVPDVGGGVVDRLAELELPVVPYNGGEAPIDKERFVNARAKDYWTLRERFEQRRSISTPDDDKLAAQLGSIKWGIDSRGRIKIESKDDMRKRGMPSPDRADAMAIAFAGRANAAPMNVESHAGESITGDLMTKAWLTVEAVRWNILRHEHFHRAQRPGGARDQGASPVFVSRLRPPLRYGLHQLLR